jgi:acyl carrier protein
VASGTRRTDLKARQTASSEPPPAPTAPTSPILPREERAEDEQSIQAIITGFLKREFLVDHPAVGIGPSDNIIELGIIDSVGVLHLAAFIEATFRIRVVDEDLLPRNFVSVERIAAYVVSRRTAAT